MELWLDGNFWGAWIRKFFISEIEWTKRTVLEQMLPSIPDPVSESDKISDEIWQTSMANYCDGDDFFSLAEYAREQSFKMYDRLNGVRQAAANMATVMLWHLLEQQMLVFHTRQVLTMHEEQAVRENTKERKKLFQLEKFHALLDAGGCSMKSLSAWSKVNELRLVANTVKHGSGPSSDELFKIRPDLFYPNCDTQEHNSRPCLLRKPAAGEDLYVTEQDIAAYFEAAISLWQEFSIKIEEHSQKRGRSHFS